MSKAMIVQAGGGFDKVIRGEREAPPPQAGEITVRLHACSLNYHDYAVVSGMWGPKEPRIPMADGAGVVTAVGPGVSEFAIGDAVVSAFFPSWEDGEPEVEGFATVPGDGVDGYARELVTTTAAAFTPAPEKYSHAEAATLTTAGLTAWRALHDDGRLKAGETVLVQGTGGVSIFALQFAKMAGATVIATSSSAAKLTKLEALGADHLINYKENPNWGQIARDFTGGRGVDHVVDIGGPGTLEQSMIAARVGGHIALIGILTGLTGELPVVMALIKQIQLKAVLVGNRRQQRDMIRAIDANGMRPVIDKSFGLEEIVEAFKYQESNRHFGKICLEF
ncbi:NAD(P)-dependent alcohol dehydrogenase [Rhodoblastus acidophilus]|uniref:NAD(P)-dependent alcohol dehydrogenase n=1 Tax=Candidatus Rhodoblastus alkanivorans TaxID=2954117 RepID=A0ABS9Z472_9HYPH|nr:NAD(P)-dependent alcohol dehydrogenase [Candidatus Rhodoblastus alkanivorans]MCI4680212.1 NAD(P)-dependent alcohol dehydrogenase [Candidatus Rhodoblastus alkanivorans]MCI4682266.1 NAD(P)-dependent alcohol dehydrogenase [Candidatus Rhodoblastus alkanivorans]MDI4639568.1 NAD(P)-dependent alcohol dehydrogenase [Rhodoblastus acidophilus]